MISILNNFKTFIGSLKFVTKGCPLKNPDLLRRVFARPRNYKYGVRCCGKVIKCITPLCSHGIKNYDEAVNVCSNVFRYNKDMNLCSVDELDYCCDNSPGGNTCGYDTDWVWVKNQGKLGNILPTL